MAAALRVRAGNGGERGQALRYDIRIVSRTHDGARCMNARPDPQSVPLALSGRKSGGSIWPQLKWLYVPANSQPAWKVFLIGFPVRVQHSALGWIPEMLQVGLGEKMILGHCAI